MPWIALPSILALRDAELSPIALLLAVLFGIVFAVGLALWTKRINYWK